MRRKLEFGLYAILILYFIVRYTNVDLEQPRRVPSTPYPQQEDAIFVPDGAQLPFENASTVEVKLESRAYNGVGTAFAVDGKGTYVTARHVVDGCKGVYFVTGPQRLEQVKSFVSARKRDFAVIKAERGPKTHLLLTVKAPARGDNGYMMGYPQGKAADVRATVIGKTEMRSSGRYHIREPVIAWVERERKPYFGGSLGGISGGPVFNSVGHIIGTVVAGAPRRGRVYSTHPKVFDETGLMTASREGALPDFTEGITADNFDSIGRSLRSGRIIAQVYCKGE